MDKLKKSELAGPASSLLRVECCICNEYISYKDGKGLIGITHSYCDCCFVELMDKIRSRPKPYK